MGYWQTYQTWVHNEDGSRTLVTRKRWVETSSSSSSTTQPKVESGKKDSRTSSNAATLAARKAAERRRILAARKNRAIRAARRRAALQRRALARRRMWDSLRERSRAIRDDIAPVNRKDPELDHIERSREVTDAKRQKEAADLRTKAAEKAKWGAYALSQEKNVNYQARIALARVEASENPNEAAKVLERLITDVRARQKKYGTVNLDPSLVRDLDVAYQKHVQGVSSKFQKTVEDIQALYEVDANGNLLKPKDEKAQQKALAITESPEFKALHAEYLRLYGDKSSVAQIVKIRNEIADEQNRYLYEAAKETLFKRVQSLGDRGAKEGDALLADWARGGKYMEGGAIEEIDPTKTSYKFHIGTKGQLVATQRTPEEEFEFRRSTYIFKLKAEYAKFKAEQAQRAGRDSRLSHEFATPEHFQYRKDLAVLAPIARALGMGDGPQTEEQKQQLVEAATKQYADKNYRLFIPDRLRKMLDGSEGQRGREWAMRQPEYLRYQKAIGQARDRYYAAFGASDPGVLGTVLNSAPAKAVIGALTGLVGGTGSGIRVIAKVTSGSSTIDVPLRLSDFPEEKLHEWVEEQQRWATSEGAQAWDADDFLNDTINKWLATPEGAAWVKKRYDEKEAKSQEEDSRFAERFYGDGDIWEKLNALGEYGAEPTNDDFTNLIFQIGADPLNALPLKATTYLARLKHAIESTKGAGWTRLGKGAVNWLKVTESELRFAKTLRTMDNQLAGGVPADTVYENIMAEVAGIKNLDVATQQAKDMLVRAGIDPRSVEGKSLLSLAQEAISARFRANGIDYDGIVEQHRLLKAAADKADEAAKAQEKAKVVKIADDARDAAEARARATAVAGHEATIAAREAEKAAIAARVARAPTAPRAPRVRTVVHPTTTTDVPVSVAAADGPARPRVSTARNAAAEVFEEGTPLATPRLTRDSDVVYLAGDVPFARGADTNKFLNTETYQRLMDDINATDQHGRAAVQKRAAAKRKLQEFGALTRARAIARREGGEMRFSRARVRPEDRVGGALANDTDEWAIASNELGEMSRALAPHTATSSELAARAGARTADEAAQFGNERVAFEQAKRKLVGLRSKYRKGKMSAEDFASEIDDVRSLSLTRRSPLLSDDLRIPGHGFLGPESEVDNLISGSQVINVGEQALTDLLEAGRFNNYYETFSLTPSLMRGIKSELLGNIMNHQWRAKLTRSGFANMLRRSQFASVDGPVDFRTNGAHLFSLFHLTLLDDNIERLIQYGKSVDTLLAKEPNNIYGRMWKVMEARAGITRGTILDSEEAFLAAAIKTGVLHPNFALAMIPYGPFARHLPIRHGFGKRLAQMGEKSTDLFAGAPATWVDNSALDAISEIAQGALTPLAAIRRASQVMHYIAVRYGDVFDRKFKLRLYDRQIQSVYNLRRVGDTGAHSYAALREEYIRVREIMERAKGVRAVADIDEYVRLEVDSLLEGLDETSEAYARAVALAESERGVALDFSKFSPERVGNEFDSIMKQEIRPGRNFQSNQEMRWAYDNVYWAGEASHTNPGLHTLTFMFKMQDPALRGMDWLRHAEAYAGHMRHANALDEARSVIAHLFAPDIARVSATEHVALAGKPVSGSAAEGGGRLATFFRELDLLPKYDAVRAQAAEARILDDATEQAEDQLARDNFWIDDVAKWDVRRPGGESRTAYAFGDFDAQVARVHRAVEKLQNAKPPKGEAPDVETLKFYKKAIKEAAETADERGVVRALVRDLSERRAKAIEQQMKLPPRKDGVKRPLPLDLGAWIEHEVILQAVRSELHSALASMVYRSLDVSGLSDEAAAQMQEAVRIVKSLGGEDSQEVFEGLERSLGQDLWSSRLGDYLKYEDYFKSVAKQVDPPAALPPRPDEGRIAKMKDQLREASVDDAMSPSGKRTMTAAEKSSLRRRIKKAESDLVVEKAAYERAIQERAGAGIQKAYDEGDIAKGQEANTAEAVRRGGSVESGGAIKESVPPTEPTIASLNPPSVTTSQRALRILSNMSETEWLAREYRKAQRLTHSPNKKVREEGRTRMNNVTKALEVIAKSRTGESFAKKSSKSHFARAASSLGRDRIIGAFAPSRITSYVSNPGGAMVEQGRLERRILLNAEVDPNLMEAGRPRGAASSTYTDHATAIESTFDRAIPRSALRRFGLPDTITGDITATELLVNLDEFTVSLNRNPAFADFAAYLARGMQDRLTAITGDPGYTVKQWLDDRNSLRGDHFDADLFERVELEVSAEIQKVRGRKRTTLTDAVREKGEAPENPLASTLDSEVEVVVAKARILKKHGITTHQYNEARRVLRPGTQRKRYAYSLHAEATRYAVADMEDAGIAVDGPLWDDAFREAYDEHFLTLRKELAEREAVKQFEALAGGEMYGQPYSSILDRFDELYGLDANVKGMKPEPISTFQYRTLEEAAKKHLGVDDLNNVTDVQAALRQHGQTPPFNDRGAMREWLVKYGFWSPRTREVIEEGHKSWSIFEEAKYYSDGWGHVPEWADPDLLRTGGPLHYMLHDSVKRAQKFRDWGLFNRNMEARMDLAGLGREERARLLVRGDEGRGLKAMRSLAQERKYLSERYGELAVDGNGNFIAFPEVMNARELNNYVRTIAKKHIAQGIAQTPEEVAAITSAIDERLSVYFDRLMNSGVPPTAEDLFVLASNVVADIMKNPVFARRKRDSLGWFLRTQAHIRRMMVFINIGFATTNVIDSQIKSAWFRWTHRAWMRPNISPRAAAKTHYHFGFSEGGQLLRDQPTFGVERIRDAGNNPFQTLLGVAELPIEVSAKVERFSKLRLAQGMFDEAYEQAFRKYGDEQLADAAATKYVKQEVDRMWPTAGDHPYERLFNYISPFASYTLKNRVMFLSELAANPAFINHLNFIGDYIEKENRKAWAIENPDLPFDEKTARLIKLPWTHGENAVFIDLGQFSDIQRGIKPFYEMKEGGQTVRDFAAQFIRLVGPNDQNIVGGILNYFKLYGHKEWIQEYKDGFPTGKWSQVEVPWEAPWGVTANALNSFFPYEVGALASQALKDGNFSVAEKTAIFYRTMFFGGLKHYDKGAAMNQAFFILKAADPEAAKAYLLTEEGQLLQAWWKDRSMRTYEWYVPKELKDLLEPPTPDPNPFFHSLPEAFQNKMKANWDEMARISEKWDAIIWKTTPGTKEYTAASLGFATERYQFYEAHPEMYEYEAMTMTAGAWAKNLNKWQLADLTQTFFDMKMPEAENFKTAVEWQKAVALWKQQRSAYLKMFPQVAESLGQTRDGIEAVWKNTEEGWFDILDTVGTRSIALEAARQAEDFDLTDQLYLVQDLQFDVLDEDVLVHYFDPTRDFKTLPEGSLKPDQLLHKDMLSRIKILPDFNKFRFDRMNLEEKAEFERNEKYGEGMKAVIAKAKASGNFGRTFVQELKKNPELLAEYFRRNPGKREEWATTDEYIRQISKYGQLAKAGKFAEAGRYFDRLPDWVKARYYAKHPERRQRAQQNLVYMDWMGRWVAHYKRRDYEGGAEFFKSMPAWVQQRYLAKHPEGVGGGGKGFGNSPYAKAMGQWVKLHEQGKKEEAKAFFDAMPKAFRDRYYSTHPEEKLRDDIKRTGQLGQYFAGSDAARVQYLKDNPEFAKWLAKQGKDSDTRRMLIMAGYRALPKDNAWLRRVYRQQYPEVFSVEAVGERSLKKTYNFLAEHSDMLPEFEKWLDAVWASYASMVKNTGTRPKPLVADHSKSPERRGGRRGRSAAWVRMHSS